MNEPTVIQKTLTANDLGVTGSHQAGVHIPKSVRDYFPSLDESKLNSDRWIDLLLPDGRAQSARFIYYNNKLMAAHGTRDEYRLTCIVPTLKALGAVVGDTLEFEVLDEHRMRVKLSERATEMTPERVTVRISGSWRVIRNIR
jgi:hypothetical protein